MVGLFFIGNYTVNLSFWFEFFEVSEFWNTCNEISSSELLNNEIISIRREIAIKIEM